MISLLVLFLLSACNGAQHEARQQAELIQKTVQEASPGAIASSANGSYLTAKLNGVDWSASQMVPEQHAGSRYKLIRGENGSETITFQIWKPRMETGKKVPFSETSSATLFLGGADIMSGHTGEVEITRMDPEWLEGRFYFTAKAVRSGKTVEVTEGRFRVPYP